MVPALKVTKISLVISLLHTAMYKYVCMFVVDIKIPLHLLRFSSNFTSLNCSQNNSVKEVIVVFPWFI